MMLRRKPPLPERHTAAAPDQLHDWIGAARNWKTLTDVIDVERIVPITWVRENLVEGKVVNRVTLDDETKKWARVSLQRLLEISS